jgi:RNA polymerase sigma-70 factor (ECF subfamily)
VFTTSPANADAAADQRLMDRLRQGDVDAYAILYRRYYALAVTIARRYVHDSVAAEDIAQECFLSLWTHRQRYRSEQGSARTWLAAITHNRAIDATRRARARPQVAASLDDAADPPADEDVAAEIERRDRSRRTRAAVAALPAPQREVVGLAAYAGLTHVEIAQRTGAPLGTVKGRSRLAVAKLRADLAA